MPKAKATRAAIIREEAYEPVKPATMSFVRKKGAENNVPKLTRVKSGLANEKAGGQVRKAFGELGNPNTNTPSQTKRIVKSETPSFYHASAAKLPVTLPEVVEEVDYPPIEYCSTIIEKIDDERSLFIDKHDRQAASQIRSVFTPIPNPAFNSGQVKEIALNTDLHEIKAHRFSGWSDVSPLKIDNSVIRLPTLTF